MLTNFVRPIRELRMAYNGPTCEIIRFCIMARAEQLFHLCGVGAEATKRGVSAMLVSKTSFILF